VTVLRLQALPPTPPVVTNSTGASNITQTSARLNGEITDNGNEDPTVHIYWGDNDGGTTPGNWDSDVNLGVQGTGTFYTNITGLTADTDYYYRCYAENSVDGSWAASTEPFTTLPQPTEPQYEILRPNAAGDITNIKYQDPTSGMHWEKVDDVTPDGDSTNIWQYQGSANTNYDLFNLPSPSASGTINFIKVYAHCKESFSGSAKIKIKTGGTEYDNGSSLALTSSWTNYSHQWDTNPATGLAWTWDDIDNLQIGVALGGASYNISYCTQVYVAVEYLEAPPIPDPPTVTNSTGASNITQTSARLNGEVTSTGGENPTVHIYWGDNDGGTTEGNWDNDVNLGTQGTGTFYTNVSGLTADTDYYYRCYAENSGDGSWATSTEPFTTLSTPTPPEPPTLVSPGTTITFKWNASSGATNYHLQVNTNPTFTETSLFDAEVGDVTSLGVTGLTLGTTYYWRVKAGNAWGWSDWSSVRSVIASEVP